MTGKIKWWQRALSLIMALGMLLSFCPTAAFAAAAESVAEIQQTPTSLQSNSTGNSAGAGSESASGSAAESEQTNENDKTASSSSSSTASSSSAQPAMNATPITASDAALGDAVTVNVNAPAGTFPDGTALTLAVGDANTQEAAISALLGDTGTLMNAYSEDITFTKDGTVQQPVSGTTVAVSFAVPQAVAEAGTLRVFRTTAAADGVEEVPADAMTVTKNEDGSQSVLVNADHFSTYTLGVVSDAANAGISLFSETSTSYCVMVG